MVKAMLLASYLDLPAARGRALRLGERAVLGPMIRASEAALPDGVEDPLGVVVVGS